MPDELYPYYERELQELGQRAGEFARAHEATAGRLGISADAVADPHVERLMQGFAFLAARIQKRLDDDFPELPRALLGLLQPQLVAPVPSMAIVQFRCPPGHAGPVAVPRHFAMESSRVEGETCRFRTAWATEVWPIAPVEARLARRPCPAPEHAGAREAQAVLRLTFESAMLTFAKLAPTSLRLHLPEALGKGYRLHDLLTQHLLAVAIAEGPDDPEPLRLPAEALSPVGFAPEEALFDAAPGASQGYRLVTEYFALPEKFLFLDLAGIAPKTARVAGRRLDVFLYLRRAHPELEDAVGPDSVALGCAPAINLFRLPAEPVTLDHRVADYRLVLDSRRPPFAEVHTVERVAAHGGGLPDITYPPFVSVAHGGGAERFWYATRRPAGFRDDSTDVFVSVTDIAFTPRASTGATLTVECSWVNRFIPEALRSGGADLRLAPLERAGAIEEIRFRTRPTPTGHRHLAQGALWRLVSMLAMNHLCLTGGAAGAAALREMLQLLDLRGSGATQAMIAGVTSVEHRRVARRFRPELQAGEEDEAALLPSAVQGSLVRLVLDPARFAGGSPLLFAAVLDHVFGHLSGINSFTQTALAFAGRGDVDVVRTWTPRAGDRPLL
jgi:type VI secretion system protein ImpG